MSLPTLSNLAYQFHYTLPGLDTLIGWFWENPVRAGLRYGVRGEGEDRAGVERHGFSHPFIFILSVEITPPGNITLSMCLEVYNWNMRINDQGELAICRS